MSAQLERITKLIGEAPEDAVELLNDVRDFIGRFCSFPDEHCLTAVTLWAAHAHMADHFHTTPRLALLSPEAASGKTRVLEVLDLLVPDSMFTLNASPATIFRSLAQQRMTLLFDEVDSIWTNRGKDDSHEDLRALLNAGYKRGASIPRCVGNNFEVVQFKVFCPVALAGLGDLPDTIMTRSVIIRMRRRAPDEQVEPFRTRTHEPIGHALRDRLATWADDIGEIVGTAWPELPSGVVDRPAEVWEPLVAVADAAGGNWPAEARAACIHLCKVAEDRQASLGIRLLADVRKIFGDAIAMSSEMILSRLTDGSELDDDAPWGDLHGKGLGKRGLASMLRKYSVTPCKVKVDGRSLQGYRREHLWDVWTRYLPRVSAEAEPAEPPELLNAGAGFKVPDRVPEVPDSHFKTEPFGSAMAGKVPEVPEVPDMRIPPRSCSKCDGSGCDECGEWKPPEGTSSYDEPVNHTEPL